MTARCDARSRFARWRHALVATSLVFALSTSFSPLGAYGATMDQLGSNYRAAITRYDLALEDQSHNIEEITELEGEIEQAQAALDLSRDNLGSVATTLYRNGSSWSSLLEMLLECDTLHDALKRIEAFEKVEAYYQRKIAGQVLDTQDLEEKMDSLEARKAEIEAEVSQAKEGLDSARSALVNAGHGLGAQYHQTQGNGSNCGATAFTVGVNTLLHDNRFTDNVEVWNGPGFEGDSTNNLVQRATKWLEENELGDVIAIESVAGDITTCEKLASLLDRNYIVLISSGPDSIWQRADGNPVGPGVFPSGHWIEFYHHESGIFFANDSSVSAAKGAGCPYTEEQMQQWLDGRSYHNAAVLRMK